MPSQRFTFICAKSTADFVVPVNASSQGMFNRHVHNAFHGLVGGYLRVGDLLDRPTAKAVPNHLFCDGTTITRNNFPELVEFLNPGEATAELPDYTGAVTITASPITQTVTNSGTVETTSADPTVPTTTPVDQGGAGGTEDGNVPSGGRVAPGGRLFPGEAGL